MLTRHLSVPPALLGARDPRAAYIEALTAETWIWGFLPHGGPCPLPGGDSCASSLMAHTASGARVPHPQKLTSAAADPEPVGNRNAAGGGAAGGRGGGGGGGARRALQQQLLQHAYLNGRGTRAGAAAADAGATATATATSASGAGGADSTAQEAESASRGARASPRQVAAGEDFVVVLGAGGRVWDSRHAAKHRHPGVKLGDIGAALEGRLVTQVAAGGFGMVDGGLAVGGPSGTQGVALPPRNSRR
jgi:hypothetical protein